MARAVPSLIAIALAGAAAGLAIPFRTWRRETLQALETAGRVVETDRGPIEVRVYGDRGPALLFLHGTPGGSDQLGDRRGEQIAADGVRLIVPSRPGYLRTPIEVGRTPRDQADAYAALLDSLGIDRVAVMGISGGGPSAVAFAGLYPERTYALILMEAVAFSMPPEPWPWFLSNDFGAWLLLRGPLANSERMLSQIVPDSDNVRRIREDPIGLELFDTLMGSALPPSRRTVGRLNDDVQFESLDDLPFDRVVAPTLIVHGTADTTVPFAHAEFLADAIPGAELFTIEGADHMMPVSHRSVVDSRVDEFVRSHAP